METTRWKERGSTNEKRKRGATETSLNLLPDCSDRSENFEGRKETADGGDVKMEINQTVKENCTTAYNDSYLIQIGGKGVIINWWDREANKRGLRSGRQVLRLNGTRRRRFEQGMKEGTMDWWYWEKGLHCCQPASPDPLLAIVFQWWVTLLPARWNYNKKGNDEGGRMSESK